MQEIYVTELEQAMHSCATLIDVSESQEYAE